MDHGSSAHSLEPRLSYSPALVGTVSSRRKMWLDLHHGECVALHADGLAQRRRHQKGEGREAHLRLAGEGGEEGDVGAAFDERVGDESQQHRLDARRIAHRDGEVGRRAHGRELSAPPRRHVLHAAVQLDTADCFVWSRRVPVRLDRSQLAQRIAEQCDCHRQRVRLAALETLLVAQRVVDRTVGLRRVEAEGDHMRLGQVRDPRARVRYKVLQPHAPRLATAISHRAAFQYAATRVAVALQPALIGALA
mmetsp:Transcript_35115/g.105621  ORF Transcript_35115/g.105621 Transcript_35115/m.105621 type:complete len:250 (-) Transcript_35115:527-1276(-)